jgi:hypothetical protein
LKLEVWSYIYSKSNDKIEITSQNHGYEIDKLSLPECLEITHISLFDKTNCGIRMLNRPVFSVQHHPEASPGPQDSFYLFTKFVDLMWPNISKCYKICTNVKVVRIQILTFHYCKTFYLVFVFIYICRLRLRISHLTLLSNCTNSYEFNVPDLCTHRDVPCPCSLFYDLYI